MVKRCKDLQIKIASMHCFAVTQLKVKPHYEDNVKQDAEEAERIDAARSKPGRKRKAVWERSFVDFKISQDLVVDFKISQDLDVFICIGKI